MEDKTITPRQLAARWGVRVETLANWRSSGVGPTYHKLRNKRVFYKASDIEAYEMAGRVVLSEPALV